MYMSLSLSTLKVVRSKDRKIQSDAEYRIYSIKRPTSNKRPHRISAHPVGRES